MTTSGARSVNSKATLRDPHAHCWPARSPCAPSPPVRATTNKMAVSWTPRVAAGCRQCEPAVNQVEPGSADCKLVCNQREQVAGFSGSESELASGLIASRYT